MSATALAVAGTVIGVVITALAGVIGHLLTRQSAKETAAVAKEANVGDSWAKLAAAHQADLAAVRSEVTQLRDRVDGVETALAQERSKRRSLEEVLRSAWLHILRLGDQVTGLGGHPDVPPAELTLWMESEGLVVDTITVSRTTVTDTRSGDQVEGMNLDDDDDEPAPA